MTPPKPVSNTGYPMNACPNRLCQGNGLKVYYERVCKACFHGSRK